MSDDSDAFDEIVNNQPEDDGESDTELTNIWEGVEHLWPHFYPGLLVKGILLAEYVDEDGDRVMRFIAGPGVTPWEMLGMIESARLDAREISQSCTLADPLSKDDDSDDNED